MTKIFISYSHKDEKYLTELEKHLSILKRNGKIDTWSDRKIYGGDEWNDKISQELENAKLILLLISPDFLASEYCYGIEMRTALEMHDRHKATVIPIILRFCDWKESHFAKLQSLPQDGKPVVDWGDIDKAFLNIVEGIKSALNFVPISPTKPPEGEQLSEYRKRLVNATTKLELESLLFEVVEFKKTTAPNFEVEHLISKIKSALEFHSSKTVQKSYTDNEKISTAKAPPIKARSKKSRFILLTLLMLFLLSMLLYIIFSDESDTAKMNKYPKSERLKHMLSDAHKYKYGMGEKYYNDTLNVYSVMNQYYSLNNDGNYNKMLTLFTPVVNTFYNKNNCSQEEILENSIAYSKQYPFHIVQIIDSTFGIFKKAGDTTFINYDIMYFTKKKNEKKLRVYKVSVFAIIDGNLKINSIKEENISHLE